MTAPAPSGPISIFEAAIDFRTWLESHHETATELWVGYYKKGTDRVSMRYEESVEEALCFGWIDGITRRIDDEVYAVRFTPRRRRSNWSRPNLERVERLIEQGRIRPAGMRAYERRDRAGTMGP